MFYHQVSLQCVIIRISLPCVVVVVAVSCFYCCCLCLAGVFVCLHSALDSCKGFAISLHSGCCCCHYRWFGFISIHIKNFKLVA